MLLSVSDGTLWDNPPDSSTESLSKWGPTKMSHWNQSEQREDSNATQHPVELLTLSAIMLLSALGNTAVLYVVGHHLHFKTVTNVFIVSLALSDLLTTLICMPVVFVKLIGGVDVLPTDSCVVSGVVSSALGVVSTLMITCIAVDRYHVVVKVSQCSTKANFTVHLACLLVTTCWVLAGFLALPWHLLISGEDHEMASLEARYHHCMYTFRIHTSPDGAIYSVLFILLCYMTPTAIISYCTVKIWLTVRHQDSRVRPATIHATQLRFSGELHTAKTVLIIAVFFYLCRLPYSVTGLIYGLAKTEINVGVDTAAMWLFWNSCAVNPCIYAVRNPVLAEALHLRRVAKVWRRRQYDHQQQHVHDFNRDVPTVSRALAVNSADITVNMFSRSDSAASVLLFSNARKGSSYSTTTTATRV